MTMQSRQGEVFPVGRFSYFLDDSDPPLPVPVLYAATTQNAALWESLLRNRETESTAPLPPSSYTGKALSCIDASRTARVSSLAGADMQKLGLVQDELIACESDQYVETIPWARAAWKAGFDGIKYVSRRDNSGLAYVFFQRPDLPALFTATASENETWEFDDIAVGGGFDWLALRLQRWGIGLTR